MALRAPPKCPVCGEDTLIEGERIDVGFGEALGVQCSPDHCENCSYVQAGPDPRDYPIDYYRRCWALKINPHPQPPEMRRVELKAEYSEWIARNVQGDGYGKCQEISREMALAFPELRRVYGTYFCWTWGPRGHFWLVDATHGVIDPTAGQFPSKGTGRYTMSRFYGLIEDEEANSAGKAIDAGRHTAQHYCSGFCDVMALALHRLTGLPLGLWGIRNAEGEFTEFAHAVVILDRTIPRWLDVKGTQEGQPNLRFDGPAGTIALYEATEQEVRDAFTTLEIPNADIVEAMAFARKHPATTEALEVLRRKV